MDGLASLPQEGPSPFEEHILSLLTTLEQNPSLAFQTPASTPKTQTQEAIERAVLALAQRASEASNPSPVLSSSSRLTVNHNALALRSQCTPPPPDNQAMVCPQCSSPIYHQTTAPTSPFASLELSSPRQTPWSNGSAGETGMSAEKELELLKAQVQDIARVCKVSYPMLPAAADAQAVATGDLTQKIIVPVKGQAMTELKDIINSMVDRLKTFATEVERVSLEVGTQGKLGGQAVVEGVEGTWRELTNVVNRLAANLTNQVRSIAKVTKAVARGDLSETITVVASGEIAELATTVNGMVRQRRLGRQLTRRCIVYGCWQTKSVEYHLKSVLKENLVVRHTFQTWKAYGKISQLM